MSDDAGGWLFFFVSENGKGVTVRAPSLTTAYARYPDLLTRPLSAVWCARTNNCVWISHYHDGSPAKPWPPDQSNGYCDIEYREWEDT